jgi:NADH-quinone oxidoreductase subunit L
MSKRPASLRADVLAEPTHAAGGHAAPQVVEAARFVGLTEDPTGLMATGLVFAPLLGFVLAGLFWRRGGSRPAMLVSTGLLFLSAALSWTVFLQVLGGLEPFTVRLAPFINVGDFQSAWSVRVDTLSAVMMVVVTTVSALVHLYSWGYMAEDHGRPRFFAYLSLFTFAMLMLVTAADFMQLFFGWEGVGLASYLLIGFWFHKPTANAAAIKAFVVNRVGDFGFALGIMTVFWMFGSIEFAEVLPRVGEFANAEWVFAGAEWRALDIACLLLFVGAMGKSAQFFLHTWLPDAMEGPTPVSALIHAATMVTAGVYMVCLLAPMFELAPAAKQFVTIIGAVTCLFAATVGLAQNDIKRVIAYSTCSQLGYMFFAAGVGAYQAAMFHLFTHAFFKALLFLGAGSVIHGMHHEQDMRRMGGLMRYLPLTFAAMTIGNIAIAGFGVPHVFGFAGFYSKDSILEAAYAAGGENPTAMFAFVVGVVVAALTAFYSFRLAFMTFNGPAVWKQAAADGGHDLKAAAHHGDDHATAAQHESHSEPDTGGHGHHDHKPHESPWTMLVPLGVLSIGAIGAGIAFYEPFFGHDAAEFWRSAMGTGGLFPASTYALMDEAHHVPTWVLWSPTVAALIGFGTAIWIYLLRSGMGARIAANAGPLWTFFYNKWFFDELYDAVFVRGARFFGDLFGSAATRPRSTSWVPTAWPRCRPSAAAGLCGSRPASSTTTPSSCCWASPGS